MRTTTLDMNNTNNTEIETIRKLQTHRIQQVNILVMILLRND